MANAARIEPNRDAGRSAGVDEAKRAQIEWERNQADEENGFFAHLGSYVAVIVFLFIVDVLTGEGWWFYWPALGWGVAVVIHGVPVFLGRRYSPNRTQSGARSESSGSGSKRSLTLEPAYEGSAALTHLIRTGNESVEAMRTSAARIPSDDVRGQAFRVCDRADAILLALAEPGRDELLAHEFVEQVLAPADTLFANYARLSERRIASAGSALRRVETNDLPVLERTLDDIHERLHQDDLVSLEVASEMLSLGRAIRPGAGTESDK